MLNNHFSVSLSGFPDQPSLNLVPEEVPNDKGCNGRGPE